MKVLHVVGKELEELTAENDSFTFMDGDVYVVDKGLDIFIWLGKDSSTDEKAIGAWVANKLDNQERGGEPTVQTVVQGEEPEEFKAGLTYTVVDDDTPGFLKHAKLDMVEYKLFRVFTKTETIGTDEVSVEEVALDRNSLKSEDVFVLDGNENIYIWIGSGANREEKYQGNKLMQKIDSTRSYLPLQYTIYEGDGDKVEDAFYNFIDKARDSGPVVSVEDQRELEFKPEESQTVEEHKAEADQEFKPPVAKPAPEPAPEPVAEPAPEPEKVKTTADIPVMEKEATPVVDESKLEEERKNREEAQMAEERGAAERAAAKKAEEEAAATPVVDQQAVDAAADKKAQEEAAERVALEQKAQEEADAARKADEEKMAAERAIAEKQIEEEEAAKRANEEKMAAEKAAADQKAQEEAAKRVQDERAQAEQARASSSLSGDTLKLYFVEGAFEHNPKNPSAAAAVIEITISKETVTLSFPPDTGLIARRTASIQAENIAKSGFLLGSGERVAIGFDLEVLDADKLSEAHFRVGHSYNDP